MMSDGFAGPVRPVANSARRRFRFGSPPATTRERSSPDATPQDECSAFPTNRALPARADQVALGCRRGDRGGQFESDASGRSPRQPGAVEKRSTVCSVHAAARPRGPAMVNDCAEEVLCPPPPRRRHPVVPPPRHSARIWSSRPAHTDGDPPIGAAGPPARRPRCPRSGRATPAHGPVPSEGQARPPLLERPQQVVVGRGRQHVPGPWEFPLPGQGQITELPRDA